MGLVTPTAGTVAPSADVLARAEALVAQALGTSDLKARTVAQAGTIPKSGLVTLDDGPCSAILTLEVRGLAATAMLKDPWTIDLGGLNYLPGYADLPYIGFDSPYSIGLGTLTEYTAPYALTFTAGWTSDNLPEAVRQAVLMTAEALTAGADRAGVKRESMGPVSKEYFGPGVSAALGANGLPLGAANMIRPYATMRL